MMFQLSTAAVDRTSEPRGGDERRGVKTGEKWGSYDIYKLGEDEVVYFGSSWGQRMFPPIKIREMPEAPIPWSQKVRKIGPGAVIASGAIGSGEIFFWPTLVCRYGTGVLWMYLLGCLSQVFYAHEGGRHAVVTAEVTTPNLRDRFIPFYHEITNIPILFINLFLPGFASLAATSLLALVGVPLPIVPWGLGWEGYGIFNVILATIMVTGPRVIFTFLSWFGFITCMFILAGTAIVISMVASPADMWAVTVGMFNFGYIPKGVDMMFLWAAINYAGSAIAVGSSYSLEVREGKFGMSFYQGRITGIRSTAERVYPTGFTFKPTKEAVKRYTEWMKITWFNNTIIFAGLTIISVWLFCAGAQAVLVPRHLVPSGLQVAVTQANIFKVAFGDMGYYFFLFVTWLTLYKTFMPTMSGRAVVNLTMWLAQYKVFSFMAKWKPNRTNFFWVMLRVVTYVAVILSGFLMPGDLITLQNVMPTLFVAFYLPLDLYISYRFPKEIRPHPLMMVGSILSILFTCTFWVFWLNSSFFKAILGFYLFKPF